MTESQRMQVMVTAKLEETIAAYQAEHSVSQSRACQALMSMGARAWKRYKQGEQVKSGADHDAFVITALKELLQASYATQALLNMTAAKELLKSCDENNQPYEAKPLIEKSHQIAKQAMMRLESRLVGKDK